MNINNLNIELLGMELLKARKKLDQAHMKVFYLEKELHNLALQLKEKTAQYIADSNPSQIVRKITLKNKILNLLKDNPDQEFNGIMIRENLLDNNSNLHVIYSTLCNLHKNKQIDKVSFGKYKTKIINEQSTHLSAEVDPE